MSIKPDNFEIREESIPEILRKSGMALSAVAILFSSLHFWPLADHKKWQLLCIPNLSVIIWIIIISGYFIYRKGRWKNTSLLPHISIFAYLAINLLSIAFANDTSRALNFTAKLILMLIGGYTLFSVAISDKKAYRLIYIIASIAAGISIMYCFLDRFLLRNETFGFFDNPYKYGTYIGMLVPLTVSYLFLLPHYLGWLFGFILLTLAILTCGSLGAIAAIICGMAVLTIVIREWLPRIVIFLSLLAAIGLIIILNNNPAITPIENEIKLLEADNINLKQRYIEWQAELNLLEERTIPGTAAGSINDYRSSYYYRLPKLNTLKAFDQNGWLATAAETGLIGFICFCWIIAYYFKSAYVQFITIRKTEALAEYKYVLINFVSLIATFVANIFSSVHYNGVLIIFVLILVLVSKTKATYTE